MDTAPRFPGSSRRRSRGGIWIFVLTVAVLVASFGAALVLILPTP